VLTDRERETLKAAMDRILPSGDDAGAADADAIAYAEWIVRQDVFQPRASCLRLGLNLIDAFAARRWRKPFLSCDVAERDEVLHRVEHTRLPQTQEFFALLVRMTIAGFLCSARYGGNRNRVGWAFIGFDGGEA
jgi:Gluconate 2-dehydrogenase subunit 3